MIGHNQIALNHKALHSLLGLITPERNSSPHNTKRIIPYSLIKRCLQSRKNIRCMKIDAIKIMLNNHQRTIVLVMNILI